MRLLLIWPGKTKNLHWRSLTEDYLERLSRFVRCEIVEVRASSSSDGPAGIDKESQRITDALSQVDVSVLLDPRGVQWSSDDLAKRIAQWENSGTKTVAFVIGGPDGVTAEMASRVDLSWSLSLLTWTHETARVLLLEQLYRAYAINHRLPFVK